MGERTVGVGLEPAMQVGASMGQTIVEKIAQAHLAEGPKRPLRTGDFVAIRPHRVMTHDNTSAVIKKFQTIGAKKIQNPKQLVFALDHDIQNQDDSNLSKYQAIEGFAKHHGVDFYPAGSGIGHQIMVERGYVLPGSFVVASDSHSNMYGALGAIGTPICAPTPPQSGPRENSGGRFHVRSRSCSKANYPTARPAKT